MHRKDIALALLLSLVLGAGWVLGKTATDSFPPIFTAALRFGIAGVAICAVTRWPRAPFRAILIAATCAITLPYSLSYIGLSRLDVSTTVMLVQLEAPLLLILSALWLGEHPSRAAWAGIALTLAGVALVAGPPGAAGQGAAVGLVVLSMLIWAVGQILVRKLGLGGQGNGFALLGAMSLVATPQLLLASLVLEAPMPAAAAAPLLAWAQPAYLGLAMTAFGVGSWYALILRYPLHRVAPYLLLVPVWSLLGGVVLLGEVLPTLTLIGSGLILAGVALATRGV